MAELAEAVKLIVIQEEELDRMLLELRTRLERDALKDGNTIDDGPLTFRNVNYHLCGFVNDIKKSTL